ncbi:MAG: hypothetical protein QXS66_09015 [Thermoproteota archaeon]
MGEARKVRRILSGVERREVRAVIYARVSSHNRKLMVIWSDRLRGLKATALLKGTELLRW